MLQTDHHNRLREDSDSTSVPGDQRAQGAKRKKRRRSRGLRKLERFFVGISPSKLAALRDTDVPSGLRFAELRRARDLCFYPSKSFRGVVICSDKQGITTIAVPWDYNKSFIRRCFYLPGAMYRFARSYLRRYRATVEESPVHHIIRPITTRGYISIFLELPDDAFDIPVEIDG